MPASSFVSNPTRTLGSVCRGNLRNTASSVAGLSFAAQPAAFAIDVSFTDAPKPHLAPKAFNYSEVARFLLVHHGTRRWLPLEYRACGRRDRQAARPETPTQENPFRGPSAGNDPLLPEFSTSGGFGGCF